MDDGLDKRRRSIRLRGYDYRQAGAYFVTSCTQDRRCLFGEIAAGAMQLNGAGRMVEQWWGKLGRKFPGARTDAFVVMPNHIHGIIMIIESNNAGANNPPVHESNENTTVGADLHIRPRRDNNDIDGTDHVDAIADINAAHIDSIENINVGGYADPPLRDDIDVSDTNDNEFNANIDPHARFNASLPEIVQWFKIMTTNAYIRGVKQSGWPAFRKRV